MTEKKDQKELKEHYLALKYKLPNYDSLNADFDIDTIDQPSKHLIKEIAKKIFERIDMFKKILETTIQPEAVLSMQEAEYLTGADHEAIGDILRRFMILDRALLIAELDNKDELFVAFINDAAIEWPKIKAELLPIIKRMHHGWSVKHTIKQLHHYMG
jgi:hypothetical protein